MANSPGIKLTAKSFQAIEKSLDAIIKKAEEATAKITEMFDIDGSQMKTMNTLKGIYGILRGITRQMGRGGRGGGRGGGFPGMASGGPGGSDSGDGNQFLMLHYRLAKAARKEQLDLAKTTYKMYSGMAKLEQRARQQQEREQLNLAKTTYKMRTSMAKAEAKLKKQQEQQQEREQLNLAKTTYKMRTSMAKAEAKLKQQQQKEQEKLRKQQEREEMALARLNYKFRQSLIRQEERLRKQQEKEREKRRGDGGTLGRGWSFVTGRLQKSAFQRYLNSMAFKTFFGGPNGLNQSFRGNNFLGLNLSRFQPGATGVLGRYRVFQKPFPGSDRNVFSLGDLGAATQNIAFGAGSLLENSFRTLTGSAIAVNKVFNGIVSSGISIISPAIGAMVGAVGDAFIGALEGMSKAIAGVIGSLTNFGTALLGMATRAVEAASDLTEAVNAARVIAGKQAANEMVRYAEGIQRQYGLSQTDSMKIMGRMAGMMRNLGGFSQDEAGMASMQLYRSAVDIASVMNKSIEDVGMQLMSGFAGRLTPLRRSAIGMTAQQLDQQAKAQGINRPGVRTDLQARARVFVEEFSRQAGLFTGDLERTQFEFANQRRKFLGQFEALFVTVGRILEPFAKAVLIAANDLMSMVLDIINPFANVVKDNMVRLTVMERFAESIKAFAWYVLWVKNAIVELVKRVWEARRIIVDWARWLARSFATLAVSMIQYSANVLEMFASFIMGLNELIPIVESLAAAMSGMTDIINLITGRNPDAEQTDRIDAQLKREREILLAARAANPNDETIDAKLARNAKNQRAILPYISKNIANFGPLGGFKTIAGKIPDEVLEQIGMGPAKAPQFLKGAAGSLQRAAAEVEKFLKGLGVVVDPKSLEDLLKKIQPVESAANPLAPAPEMGANRLVQYFSPSAFRDAMQESERTPMQKVAENTGDILKLLQGTIKDTLEGRIRRPPEFNMLNAPVTLP